MQWIDVNISGKMTAYQVLRLADVMCDEEYEYFCGNVHQNEDYSITVHVVTDTGAEYDVNIDTFPPSSEDSSPKPIPSSSYRNKHK